MAKKIKPAFTKKVNNDVEINFYIWEQKKGETYTASIRIADAFCILTRVIKGRNGYFIAYPSYEDKNGDYHDQAYCFDTDIINGIADAVQEFVHECID